MLLGKKYTYWVVRILIFIIIIRWATLTSANENVSYNHNYGRFNANSQNLALKVNVAIEYAVPKKVPKLLDPFDINNQIVANNRSMLDDATLSDFTFNVLDKEFKVHKAVLAASSPVFYKMFTTDMKESRENKCKIEDIDPAIFGHMLRFIYAGDLPENIDEIAMTLYAAAHVYSIDRLKDICKYEARRSLSAQNAMEYYSWCCIYDLDELKSDAWKIIKW